MNEYIEQAISKINKEYKGLKSLSRSEQAVAEYVKNELEIFCRQDAEFAQAIVQTDKTLKGCIKNSVEGAAAGYISDLDVYKRAVEFYFPGATVHMTLTIDLIGSASADKPASGSIDLSFDELFD